MNSPTPAAPALARTPLLIIGSLAAAWGAFSSVGIPDLALVVGIPMGIAWGLIWTLIAALVARPLLRARARSARAPELAALAAALGGALLFGPGLYTHLTYLTPEAYLGLMMSEDPGAAYAYFMVLNPLMEWVIIPAAVLLNWNWARRRTVVAAGAILYLSVRAWTYLYFAPTALSWHDDAGKTPTQDQLDQAQQWMNLDWPRIALDLTVAVVFAVLVLLPRTPGAEPRRSAAGHAATAAPQAS